MSESITDQDAEIVRAIIRSFYGESYARKFTTSSITDETLVNIIELLSQTEDCSTWIDAVPNPKDLLMPSKSLRKWALKILRKSGEPFLSGNIRVNIMCKRFRAAQFRNGIVLSLQ